MIGNKLPLILVIDDMSELLATVSEMLSSRYKVIGAKSYVDAMDILYKHTPSLFLLDIDMPTFDGYDIATFIRLEEKFQNTPIVFLTSRANKESVIKAIKSGGDDYIAKPVKKSVLLKKVEANLRRLETK